MVLSGLFLRYAFVVIQRAVSLTQHLHQTMFKDHAGLNLCFYVSVTFFFIILKEIPEKNSYKQAQHFQSSLLPFDRLINMYFTTIHARLVDQYSSKFPMGSGSGCKRLQDSLGADLS